MSYSNKDLEQIREFLANNIDAIVEQDKLKQEVWADMQKEAEESFNRSEPMNTPTITTVAASVGGIPFDWEAQAKQAVSDKYERYQRGGSGKPHRKHGTNYTPPKRRHRK